MAVAVDQQHHGFSKSFGLPPPPPRRSKHQSQSQSHSHLEYYNDIIMPEFATKTNFAHTYSLKEAYFEQVSHLGTHRSFSTPCLPLLMTATASTLDWGEGEEEFDDAVAANIPKIKIIGGQSDLRARALVVEIAMAMAFGGVVDPVPISSSGGPGGAYFLHDKKKSTNYDCTSNPVIAVVKPIDEKPPALNRLEGGFVAGQLMMGQLGIRSSIRVDETGVRELAAYLLDHSGFAGVPPTALVKISQVAFHHHHHVNLIKDAHSIADAKAPTPLPVRPPFYKIASVQRFIEHVSDAGDLGPSAFSVSSIHRIGILDVRLLNLDRHAGNMLVIEQGRGHDKSSVGGGAHELVPIDHGLCLPEWLDDPYFEWLHWPQALVPFSDSEVEYIRNLDPFEDAQLLRKEFPNSMRESSIRVLVLCTIFLKQAVVAGLCLANIGEMMTREFRGGSEEHFSILENICLNAEKATVMRTSILSLNDDRNCIAHHQCEEETGIFQLDDNHIECNKMRGGHICFGEIGEEEWELFLENFEKLLPEFFESRKNTGLMDQQ